jgi:hypothetical protein
MSIRRAVKRFVPIWRHVVTCLPCGFREGTGQGNAYAERCPYCGGELEHYEATIATLDELERLGRVPSVRRLAATTGDHRALRAGRV